MNDTPWNGWTNEQKETMWEHVEYYKDKIAEITKCWASGPLPVDGYESITKTVFQYHGCKFHDCAAHCEQGKARDLFQKTQQQEQKIKAAGYTLVVTWECNKPQQEKITIPQPQSMVYPHTVVYDFEAYLDKTKRYSPTADLTYENTHVPISVSVGDTMDSQPTDIELLPKKQQQK